jgi:hypothetical protein
MGDIFIFEGPDYLKDGVCRAEGIEELAANSLFLAEALGQPPDIDILDLGGGGFLGVEDVAQLLQPFIRDLGYSRVGGQAAGRVRLVFRRELGESIEDSSFPASGQTYNTYFHRMASLT